MLTTRESNRAHAALLSSQKTWPIVLFYDDSCGFITFMYANYPAEAEKLFGNKRGCFREWKNANDDSFADNLERVSIPELSDQAARDLSQENACRTYARQMQDEDFNRGGEKRLLRHPYLPGQDNWERVVVSDRFHQGKGSKSHRRPTCAQHNCRLCKELDETPTSFMESTNARRNRYLKSICTGDPIIYVLMMHKLSHWVNRKIYRDLMQRLAKQLSSGEALRQDPDFGFMCTVKLSDAEVLSEAEVLSDAQACHPSM